MFLLRFRRFRSLFHFFIIRTARSQARGRSLAIILTASRGRVAMRFTQNFALSSLTVLSRRLDVSLLQLSVGKRRSEYIRTYVGQTKAASAL